MTHYEELNRFCPDGWTLDLEYMIPRIIFHKRNSTCYIYKYNDLEEHLRSCELTTLEYLEGKSFYREHCMELLKIRMEDRIPVRENSFIS
jgi:hypothetical protein